MSLPNQAGPSPHRDDVLTARIAQVCKEHDLPFVDCAVVSDGEITTAGIFSEGVADWPVRKFLLASITKPIVAMAILKLAAEGRLTLTSRVPDLLPGFRNRTFRRITVRHLLTHSSGLSETVVANIELRQQAAPLCEFMSAAVAEELDFPAGTNCRYSSIGYMLLGAIVESVSGQALSDYLRTQFFEPLSMTSTSLGTTPDDSAVLPNRLPVWQQNADTWDWNSEYWKTFGAAWGGMYSTAEDLAKLAQMLLSGGQNRSGQVVLPSPVVQSLMTNQTQWLRQQPEFSGPAKDWSFGFRMQWPFHSASFGDFVSEHTVGHWGATGTVFWIDPERNTAACVLTTVPFEESATAIQRISNLLSNRRSS